MTRRMLQLGVDHCWLDVTGLDRFAERFPSLARVLAEVGLDPATDWLPIAPAAHYLCGGVVTDLDGATTLPGLWAAGEVACTGVHGANRLASNSLLEGLVFGARAVDAVARGVDGPGPTGAMRAVPGGPGGVAAIGGRPVVGWRRPSVRPVGEVPGRDLDAARHRLQRAMTEGAGVLRDAGSLESTAAVVAEVDRELDGLSGRAARELGDLVDVARAMLAAAEARTESRGAHTRADFPLSDPAQAVRLVLGGP